MSKAFVSSEPILITGVGRRVGLHLANTFLQRQYKVIGTYRTRRKSLAELKRAGAELYQCDFNSDENVRQFADTVITRHSKLRGIIHNASDWLPDNHDLPLTDIMERMMKVHVTAPYLINHLLAPLLESSNFDYADIIHNGEYVSKRGSTKHIAYAASKAAQDSLTHSFSAKFGPKIKVNSVAPTLVIFNEDDKPEYRKKALSKSIMGREGGLDEFQHAVDYLMSSHYVTGSILPMDGGRHLR
jgi:dihydromonapterin reductase/dihydrofolate reductase